MILYIGELPLLFQLVTHTNEKSDNMVVIKCGQCDKKLYYNQAKAHALMDHHRTKIRLIPRKEVLRESRAS